MPGKQSPERLKLRRTTSYSSAVRATCLAWDKAQQWIAEGEPGVNDKLPPGAKWVTEEMYELDGQYHFRDRKGYDRP